MQDSFGRNIDYLRISVTDRCNLRCRYCMPDGIQTVPMADILTFEEMLEIAGCAAKLGIKHIKVTGGEPLVRKGCCGFVESLKKLPGIETVTMTTNGILLKSCLEELKSAGIDGINISMDTRNEALYRLLTGGGDLKKVFQSIESALDMDIHVKINTVSADWSHLAVQCKDEEAKTDWREMVELARTYPVDVRFIEIMPIGYGKQFSPIDHRTLKKEMKAWYPQMEEDHSSHGFGPAVYYHIPGFAGSIGFISAIHGKFCHQCNRVRLTAQGMLKTCLCYDDGTDLRAVLREGQGAGQAFAGAQEEKSRENQDVGQTFDGAREKQRREDRLLKAMEEAVRRKAEAHCFEAPEDITENHTMSSIGG